MAKTPRKQSTLLFLNLCSNELKPLLGELTHTETKRDSNRYIYALIPKNSSNSITPDDRGNRLQILPLFPIQSNSEYWINISLTFLSNQSKPKIKPENSELAGVSIKIFKGALASAKKELLFRAEWDALKDNNHAQPHWHVCKSFQTRDSNVFKESDFTSSLSNEVKDFGAKDLTSRGNQEEVLENLEETNFENEQKNIKENDWDSATKFHFAMASQWHTSNSNHRIVLAQETLPDWLVGCVQYIQEQLKYVSGSR